MGVLSNDDLKQKVEKEYYDQEGNVDSEEQEIADEIDALLGDSKDFTYEDKNDEEIQKHLKKVFLPLTQEYKKLSKDKDELERKTKKINKKIMAIEAKIRSEWLPFVKGAEEASIALEDDTNVSYKKVLNISAVDKPQAINWFMDNGFKDVLKYDIHHKTMSSIAAKHLKKTGEEIDGLKYSEFLKVKIK